MKHAKAIGWVAWKMKIEGINGCPLLVFKAGHLLIMEVQGYRREGERPAGTAPLQELREAGTEVHVIDDPARGIELLDAWS